MKKITVVMLVVLAAGLVLVACGPSGLTTEEAAQPTDEAAMAGETQTLFVGPELVDCVGVGPMECMQVRRSPDEPYGLFYDQIEGFTFEPGFEYELLVSVTPVENPPADGSSLKYSLVEVKSKTAAASGAAALPGDAGASLLENTRWVLATYLSSDGVAVPALPEATAVFRDGQVSGNASCNNYTGSYTADASNLSIGPLASSMMACVDQALMEQETQFLAQMQAAASYVVNGGTLEIINAQGRTVLSFIASQPTSLTGTTWNATMVNNNQGAVSSLVAGTAITALFGEDGVLSGSAGCNTYTAGYTIDGDQITIEQPATTMMMCAEAGVMEQEAAYLAQLPLAATYSIAGSELELRTADGALIAAYTAGVAEVVPPIAELPAAEARALEDTRWVLGSFLNADGAVQAVAEGSEVTAVFSEGQVGGSAGCNSYGGAYNLDGESLTIGPLVSTMMACEEPLMSQETQFLANMQATSSYRISGDLLDLLNAEGTVLVSFNATESTSLTGTDWTAVMVNNGREAVSGLIEGTSITALFGEDGSLSGSAGCNTYNASYSVDGNAITISQPASTMMACEEAVMAQESAYLTMLPQAATYAINGDRMEIRTADGALIVEFAAAGVAGVAGATDAGAAVVSSPVEGQPALEETRWVLATFLGQDGAVAPAAEGFESTAVFEEGRVGGNGGCNRYGGNYTLDGSNLTVGPLMSTMMACEPARMQQEQALFSNLQAAATYTVNGTTLEIKNADGLTVLTFAATEPIALAGTLWTATGVNNGRGGVASLVAGTSVTALFGEDGSLTGSAGCNNYMSSYTAEGDAITIQQPASTRKLCPGEGVMEQENAYLSQLPLAATYRIDGDRLELRSAEGALIASYVATPAGN
jgi:heat shock protein HslJ